MQIMFDIVLVNPNIIKFPIFHVVPPKGNSKMLIMLEAFVEFDCTYLGITANGKARSCNVEKSEDNDLCSRFLKHSLQMYTAGRARMKGYLRV